jgi:hypothetical protein
VYCARWIRHGRTDHHPRRKTHHRVYVGPSISSPPLYKVRRTISTTSSWRSAHNALGKQHVKACLALVENGGVPQKQVTSGAPGGVGSRHQRGDGRRHQRCHQGGTGMGQQAGLPATQRQVSKPRFRAGQGPFGPQGCLGCTGRGEPCG